MISQEISTVINEGRESIKRTSPKQEAIIQKHRFITTQETNEVYSSTHHQFQRQSTNINIQNISQWVLEQKRSQLILTNDASLKNSMDPFESAIKRLDFNLGGNLATPDADTPKRNLAVTIQVKPTLVESDMIDCEELELKSRIQEDLKQNYSSVVAHDLDRIKMDGWTTNQEELDMLEKFPEFREDRSESIMSERGVQVFYSDHTKIVFGQAQEGYVGMDLAGNEAGTTLGLFDKKLDRGLLEQFLGSED